MKIDLRELYTHLDEYLDKEVVLEGWIKNHRKQKEMGFIDFFDGTYFKSVQLVYESKLESFDEIAKLHIGSAITVKGKVISSPKEEQIFEISVFG